MADEFEALEESAASLMAASIVCRRASGIKATSLEISLQNGESESGSDPWLPVKMVVALSINGLLRS